MILPRPLFRFVLVASLGLVAGCGGTTPEVDTAETIRRDPTTNNAPAPSTAPDPSKK